MLLNFTVVPVHILQIFRRQFSRDTYRAKLLQMKEHHSAEHELSRSTRGHRDWETVPRSKADKKEDSVGMGQARTGLFSGRVGNSAAACK